ARRYGTTLVGTVKEKKEFKTKVEAPLVQAASADLDQVSAAIEAMRPHLERPLLTGSPAQSKRLASALPAARAALEAGVAALSQLRSEYQRDQQVRRLEAQRADVEPMFRTIEQRVAPTVRTLPGRGVLATAGPTRPVHQLLVRIYPEPLAVDSHEDGLTDLELSDGAVFWTATMAAGADEQLRLGAWRALCIGRSTRRAAWIARVTEPAEPEETAPTPGAEAAAAINAALTVMEKRLSGLDAEAPVIRERLLERRPIDLRPRDAPPTKSLGARQISAVEKALQVMESSVETTVALAEAALAPIQARLQTVLAAVEGLAKTFVDVPAEWARRLGLLGRAVRRIPVEPAPEPEIPGVGHRTGTWTRAASSSVLPHRFAVFTVNDGKAVKVGAGRPIPPELALGLDPGTDTFSLEDGLLVVPDTIRWMTDFDEAEAKGMALRLTLTPEEAARGFDELLVLGLSDGDAADGEGRLTAMLEAHHYTGEGLSLLSVGTPTNNTEDDQAGFSTADDPDAAYAIERGPSLVAAQDSDGGRLAAALGIAPDVVAHVAGASATDAKDAQLATRVLYPGTVGHALEELVPGLVSRDARDRLRSYALGDVS
ncbi:MAG TPA: hypothetical protein PKA93_11025, partial [Arachnia sp.]|nr:hypothetical protein [Arachnia sp.]